jgi:hypothetical protein
VLYCQNEDKKNIELFINTINGFSQLKRILLLLREHSEHFTCLLLQEIFELDSKFEEFCEIVDHFETLFDHNEALENYFIIPKPGTSSEFDVAIQQEKLLKSQFTEYLTKIKKELKYAQIVYNVKSPSTHTPLKSAINSKTFLPIFNWFHP